MLTRALIVLLVVLNLGLGLWWTLRGDPPPPPAPAQPADVARLQLLSERSAGQPAAAEPGVIIAPEKTPAATSPTSTPTSTPEPIAAAPAEETPAEAEGENPTPEAPPAADPASSARCFSLGPFDDASAATAARARLPSDVQDARTRSAPGRANGPWSVIAPPQSDRAAADALAERISAAGFKDYYIIATGAEANGIALGRFGSEASARRHQAALQAAGFSVQARGPAEAGGGFWLDVTVVAPLDGPTLQSAVGAQSVQSCAGWS